MCREWFINHCIFLLFTSEKSNLKQFYTKAAKLLFNQSATRATSLYLLFFSRLMRNEKKDLAVKKSSGVINDLLNVLVGSFLCIRQNTAQLVEILSVATHKTCNKF